MKVRDAPATTAQVGQTEQVGLGQWPGGFLQVVAERRFKSWIRNYDCLGRSGGEEAGNGQRQDDGEDGFQF